MRSSAIPTHRALSSHAVDALLSPRGIDHVGIAVEALDAAILLYEELLDSKIWHRDVVEKDGIEVALFDLGTTRIELMAPTSPTSSLQKFLEKRGPGIHHVAYCVDDVDASLAHAKTQGFALIDTCGRPGAHGRTVGFLHPHSTGGVLTEWVSPAPPLGDSNEGTDTQWVTDSGIPLPAAWRSARLPTSDPGEPPYRRGIRQEGYRSRLWTMRQYAGFGDAVDTNRRFHQLVAAGQTGLSTAFDLPTQMGLDSDDPRSHGEVGRAGVAISSRHDMALLVADLPLDQLTISMTINAPASLLVLMYELCATQRGIPKEKLGGTIQNDILKEYAARGTYVFPAAPSMRLFVDTISYCASELPRWNPVSISGYHMREAGATAVQELAFTFCNALAYGDALRDAGHDLEALAPRMTFFFNVGSDFLEEVAKFRAARELWSTLVEERWGITDPRARMLRCHAQTGGATLTAQQPLNNVVRVALQALAATLGGVQSLHTNSYDEALALPSEAAAELALRTQQIIAHESGIARTVDPLGGSFAIEELTAQLIAQTRALMARVEEKGGAVAAIDAGFYQDEIGSSAYRFQQEVEDKRRQIVGVNSYENTIQGAVSLHQIPPSTEVEARRRLEDLRRARDGGAVTDALAAVTECARGTDNLLPVMRTALAHDATLGEICSALASVFGRYHETVEMR